MTNKIENKTGYAYYQSNMGPELVGKPNRMKRHRLVVEFILDPCEGAWHHREDLMRHIAQHSYVATVELVTEEQLYYVTWEGHNGGEVRTERPLHMKDARVLELLLIDGPFGVRPGSAKMVAA